ncbi:hypothetical protein DLE60_10475 [Micromonospora globispora]|uniref:Uncharacterized protein n=1 Tax=Micromonospora globispora TaxID=1450148 RepID=A0A317KGD9_9ACTN|nr:hypothetical protein DLJ46_02575 [Micromonospora globispora]PWU60536.1 hypothetical protein DLE60_10475 [Micromonospora globispora]RQW85326.1 hypothetical protein DKL51_28750 [Micromonospora globispora]
MVIAAEDDVDRWLAGAGHDELIDPYGESDVLLRRVGGATGRSLRRPSRRLGWRPRRAPAQWSWIGR